MPTGSCLCNSIHYETTSAIEGIDHCHFFVASKAPWFEITDALPQYPEYPEYPPSVGG